MLNIFDIVGPVMVGPSSSHTAGAVRIGNMGRTLLGSAPQSADIGLYGSFAETGQGHGTDRALIAGLLGMKPDDLNIPQSFTLAKEQRMLFHFHEIQLREAHPNTAILTLLAEDGHQMTMQACSTGGGSIRVDKIDGIEVGFTGDYTTLIIHSTDNCGKLSEITRELSLAKINIANMSLFRHKRGGAVLMVIETDELVALEVRALIEKMEGVERVTYYEKEDA